MLLTSTNIFTYDEYVQLMKQNPSYICGEEGIDVTGMGGAYYQVSNLGRFRTKQVIRYSRGNRFGKKGDVVHEVNEIILPSSSKSYYPRIKLYIPELHSSENLYTNYAHRIVAFSFYHADLSDSSIKVDHIDNNRKNLQLTNLQLCTNAENGKKSYLNDENNRWSNRKPGIVCVETGIIYPSLKYINDNLNISDSRIISSIKTGNAVGGYHWKYADKQKQEIKTKNIIYKQGNYRFNHSNSSNWIFCPEIDRTMFASDMTRMLKLSSSDVIYNAIAFNDGYSKSTDKHFYIVNNVDYLSENIQKELRESIKLKHKLVYCCQDNLVFESIKSAAEQYNCSIDSVSYSIKYNKKVINHSLQFMYYKDIDNLY